MISKVFTGCTLKSAHGGMFSFFLQKTTEEKLVALNLFLGLGNQLNPTWTVKQIRLVDIDGATSETAMITPKENRLHRN